MVVVVFDVCACVRACARACVRTYVCACVRMLDSLVSEVFVQKFLCSMDTCPCAGMCMCVSVCVVVVAFGVDGLFNCLTVS